MLIYYLCCLSCLCWYRKQRLSNLWQWAFHLESINAMVFEWSHCYSQPRPPLVLVSYLFHKQKKISKLGWAAIWQSVCLKLIFNTRKIYIRYVQRIEDNAMNLDTVILWNVTVIGLLFHSQSMLSSSSPSPNACNQANLQVPTKLPKIGFGIGLALK